MTEELLESDVVGSMLGLLRRGGRIRLQLAALRVLSSLAASCLPIAERLLRPDLVDALLVRLCRAVCMPRCADVGFKQTLFHPCLSTPRLRPFEGRLDLGEGARRGEEEWDLACNLRGSQVVGLLFFAATHNFVSKGWAQDFIVPLSFSPFSMFSPFFHFLLSFLLSLYLPLSCERFL